MKRWDWSTIGECCELTSGGTPSKHNPKFWTGDLPFVSARDLKSDRIETAALHIARDAVEESSAKIAPVGSLLMLVRGMGLANGIQIGEVTSPVAFNQDIRAIHPPKTIVPRFLLLALRNSFLNGEGENVLSSAAHGTLKIDTVALRSMAIPLPPLPEQQRIVGILDEAFAGIATAKANAEKNLRNARELFTSELHAIFAEEWTKRELVSLSSLAEEITDGDHLPPPKASTGVPFITIGNIDKQSHAIDFSDTFMVPRSYYDRLKDNKKPRGGDVLYTVTGSFGIPIVVQDEREFCFQRHIAMIRPNLGTESLWLYYLFLSPQMKAQAEDKATGTAQRTVSLKVLRSYMVPSVAFKEQGKMIVRLDRLSTKTQRLASLYKQKLAALDALKKSLLHQAFSGQLGDSERLSMSLAT